MKNNTTQTGPENQNQPSQSSNADSNYHYRVSFGAICDFLSKEQLEEITKVVKKRETSGEIISIDRVRKLEDQMYALDNLVYELKTGTEILRHLIQAAFPLVDKKAELISIMNNISNFMHDTFISKTTKVTEELNEVLEYEGNKTE